MNNGKKFEKLVRLIQETLKDIPNTEIFSNYKIKNNGGRDSEIDVIIKASINNMKIWIAIECKDYKNPIPVEKIDAFNSKCQRIKGISKKVFVSSNGYQAGAYDAAKEFNIELYELREISRDLIFQWFPISQLKPNIKLSPHFKIQIQGNKNIVEEICINPGAYLCPLDNNESILIENFLWSIVVDIQQEIKNVMLFYFIKNSSNMDSKVTISIPINLSSI